MFSMSHRKTKSRQLEDGETIISNKISEHKSLQAFKNGKKNRRELALRAELKASTNTEKKPCPPDLHGIFISQFWLVMHAKGLSAQLWNPIKSVYFEFAWIFDQIKLQLYNVWPINLTTLQLFAPSINCLIVFLFYLIVCPWRQYLLLWYPLFVW